MKRSQHYSIATLSTIALLIGLSGCQQPSPQSSSSSQSSEDLPGQGVTVRPAYAFLEELFQTEVVNIGLETLGYTIETGKEIEYATMHIDLANGGIDYTAVHWEQLHNDFFINSGGEEQLERVGTIVNNVLQGYAIDKSTADQYSISSLEQLKDPEIATLFDTDGDGRANLTGCNPGWGCELVIEHHLDEYSLRETVQHDQGQYFALMADTITRFEQSEPILYYTWTPLWVSGVLTPGEQVEWLEVPYTSLPEAQGAVTDAETTMDGKNLGFALDRIMVLANKAFLAANPSAARFMEQIQIPIDAISAQNQLMQNGEDDPEAIRRHAQEWVSENQDLFDSWVTTALEEQ